MDMDLAKFFDAVNHDKLLSKLSHRIKDQRLLRLIRFYLRAGLRAQGLGTVRDKGRPQGGPRSPLLSNIVLDDLDQELARRGHAFCRYADEAQDETGGAKGGSLLDRVGGRAAATQG